MKTTFQQTNGALNMNIKNIIICVVNIIIFLIIQSIHIKDIIICVILLLFL